MPITIKQLVAEAREKISHLKEDETHLLTLVRAESCLAVSDLLCLLEKYAESSEALSLESVAPFTDFLCDRWLRVAHTSAAYPHSPFSLANKSCFELASILAQHLQIASPYFLLMPTLPFDVARTSRGERITALSMDEFVLGEDLTPIEVLACLDEFSKHPQGDLYHTAYKEKRPLTPYERELIKGHSKESCAYWTAITIDMGVAERRAAFVESLKQHRWLVNINCGDAKRDVLLGVIMQRVKNIADLARMLCCLPKDLYIPLLGELKEARFKALFFEETLDKSIADDSHYTDDEIFNKTLLFIYAYLYWRLCREKEAANNTMFYLGCVLGSYTRQEKYDALLYLERYLLDKEPLEKLKDSIKGVGVSALEGEKVHDERLNSNVKQRLSSREQGAILDGRLGRIVEMADKVGKPGFKEAYRQRSRVILQPF